MNANEQKFLAELAELDGWKTLVTSEDFALATKLHEQKLCFMVSSHWPDMLVRITYEGRRELARS